MVHKASVLAALGGLAVLAATGLAQAQCVNCGFVNSDTLQNCDPWAARPAPPLVLVTEFAPVPPYRATQWLQYAPRLAMRLAPQPAGYSGYGYPGYGAAGYGGYQVRGRYGYGRYGGWDGRYAYARRQGAPHRR